MAAAVQQILLGRGYPYLINRLITRTHVVGGFIQLGINNRGDVYANVGAGGPGVVYQPIFWPEWAGLGTPGISNIGAPYDVYMSTISGPPPSSGNPPDTWHSLNFTGPLWGYPIQLGANQFTWQLRLRVSATGSVIAIGQYTFDITGTP